MEHPPQLDTASVSLLDNSTSGLAKILKAARKHWPIAVACISLTTGISVVYTRSQRKVYATQSLVEIDAEPKARYLGEKAQGMTDIGAADWDTYTYTQTQLKVIVSDNILGKVVSALGLATDPDFGGSPKTPAAPDIAAGILRGHVKVDQIKDSRLVTVRIEDFDPARAKKISDTLDNVYIEENLNTAIASSSDAVSWLTSQLDHVEKQLEETENHLHEFKEKNDLPSTSINDASNMLRMEMTAYTEALSKAHMQDAEISARVGELEKIETNPEQIESSELLKDGFLTGARTAYETAVNAKSELIAAGKGSNHPLVKEADVRVQSTHEALLEQIQNIRGALEHDLATIRRQEATEQSLYETSKRQAVDLNMKEIEYHRLDRERDQSEKLYQFLLERLKEADLAKMMRANNIRVVDWAPEPRGAIRPVLSFNLMMGFVAGLIMGVLLAWLREQLDSTLRMPEDVESKLGTTFLGLLPEVGTDAPARGMGRKVKRSAIESPELIVHKRPLSGFAEAARAVRTNLMFMNPDDPIRRILVTSAAPTEGKTMVACSIAIALAQGGLRVCIVDCDLRRPRLHRVFDRVGDSGITNVLLGEATLEEVAKPTAVENLWSIPAGPMPPNPADALHSERFRDIIRKLGEQFDRVIVDSPPLVAVTDGTILSKICDGTVFVVRAFKTSKFLCRQALRSLRDVDAPLLGVVLNAVDLNKHEYTYSYYHYTYYKRQGYGRPEESEALAPPAAPN
jgi:succinoglycan biosynthesis transport protein ExoP